MIVDHNIIHAQLQFQPLKLPAVLDKVSELK